MASSVENESFVEKLPVDLLERIIDFIDSPKSVASLSQTCKQLRHLTEEKMYRSVLISDDKADAFAKAIASRSKRKDMVREVSVHCDFRTDEHGKKLSARTRVPLFVEFARLEVLSLYHWGDLEDLRLDVTHGSEWETDHDRLTELLRQAGMSTPIEKRIWTNLRCCTLDFWNNLGHGWYCFFEPAIFLVASLQELALRGFLFLDADGEEPLYDSPYRGQMPLRKLRIESSYIHHTALFNILSAPRALTHLTLQLEDSLWDDEMGEEPTSDNLQDWLIAFNQQKHSLQFLSLSDEMQGAPLNGLLDLKGFSELRTVRCDKEIQTKVLLGPRTVFDILPGNDTTCP